MLRNEISPNYESRTHLFTSTHQQLCNLLLPKPPLSRVTTASRLSRDSREIQRKYLVPLGSRERTREEKFGRASLSRHRVTLSLTHQLFVRALFVKRNWSIRFWRSLYFELPVGDESRGLCFMDFSRQLDDSQSTLNFPTLVCRDICPVARV